MLTRALLPGSCGGDIQNGDAKVALSVQLMNNPANPNSNPICNKQISIHNPITGTDTIATVADTCQACALGDLDVMEDLFYVIAPNGDGRVHGIEWTPIGWTVPGGSDESATTQPSASSPAAPQPSSSATAETAAEAVQNVGIQEKVAVVAPSVTSTPAAASSVVPAVSPSLAPAMPSAAPAGSSASCTMAGESVCSADGTQIGTCNIDLSVEMGPVAAGTKCKNGYLVMASSRLRSRRGWW